MSRPLTLLVNAPPDLDSGGASSVERKGPCMCPSIHVFPRPVLTLLRRNAPKFAESNKSAVGLALHLEEEQNDHIRMVIGMVAVWVLQRCHSTREPASESEGAMDAKCGGTPLIWPTTAQLLVLLDDVGDCYGDEEYPTKAQLHDTLRTTVDEGYIKKSNVQSPPSHHRLCIIGLETPEALCEFLFYLRGVCRRRRTSVAFTTGTAIVSRLSWGDGGEEFPSEARAIDRLEVDCVSDDLWDDGE